MHYAYKSVSVYDQQGCPKKGAQPLRIEYQLIDVTLVEDIATIYQAKLGKGRFILATNQLDKAALPDPEFLSTYKEQSGTESGFKFIKDNTFAVDSIFLKKPTRISALMMLMTLCLMVYSFAQYFLRKELVCNNQTILSQSVYATNRLSMKWVYRLFHGIHVMKLQIDDVFHKIVVNMNEILIKIVRYFGPVACSIYEVDYQNA